MYFSAEEVRLIRVAAEMIPLGGMRDPGRAQLSSLVEYAAAATLPALVMDIDARSCGGKLSRSAAAALCDLVTGITLSEEERRRLPQPADQRQTERALRHKRAMALRYANKLRTIGAATDRPIRRTSQDDVRRRSYRP